jgi:hypothetical protein
MEIQISGYSVSNYCAKILTTGGTEPQNLTVKAGSNTPGDTSASVTLNVDHLNAHGIFTPAPNQNNPYRSICDATVTIEITDLKGDASDSTVTRQCSASFRVINDAPEQGSTFEIYDNEPEAAARTGGNLISGNKIYVASSPISERPSYCSNPLNSANLECTGSKTPVKTRTNPFEAVLTVRDDNGLKDINYATIWLQKNGEPEYPVQTAGGRRRSVQGIFSDYRNTELNSLANDLNKNHWLTRADINTNLLSPNTNFYGIRFNSDGTGSYNVARRFQTSSFQDWQAQGFPDCLDTANKCKTPNRVPLVSRNIFTTDRSVKSNYTWDVTEDNAFNKSQRWVCYDTNLTTRLVDNCDGTCAACIRRTPGTGSGVSQVDANTLKFRFQIQVNDRMLEGNYSLRVTADDKVGSRLNNMTNEWGAVRSNGNICAGNCANGNNLDIIVDKTPPDLTVSFEQGTGDELTAVVTGLNDSTEGSGVAGKYGLVMMRQTESGTREFLKTSGGCALDGSANSVNCAAAGIVEGYRFSGAGLQGGDIVSAYVCIYDNAGNGACKKDKYQAYTVQDNWVKTSLGTVYSSTGSSNNAAFKLQIPSAPNDRSKAAKMGMNQPSLVYGNYSIQRYTLLTGMFITGAQAAGVQGGNSDQFPSGFDTAYRNLISNPWIKTTITDTTTVSDWYARTLALANFNCPNLGTDCVRFTAANRDQFAAHLSDSSAKYKIITLQSSMVGTQGGINQSTVSCRNNSLIFVPSGINIEISSQLIKATGIDNCIFIVADGGKLAILDNETQEFEKDNTPSTEKDVDIDLFQASIIAEGTFETVKGTKGADNKFDQLQIHGFVFSRRNTPKLGRDLVFSENTKYPSEWLFYDSSVLENLRGIVGATKFMELKCGTSAHPVCSDK